MLEERKTSHAVFEQQKSVTQYLVPIYKLYKKYEKKKINKKDAHLVAEVVGDIDPLPTRASGGRPGSAAAARRPTSAAGRCRSWPSGSRPASSC